MQMETRGRSESARLSRKMLVMFLMVRQLGREREESTHLDRYADEDEEQVGDGETEQEGVGDFLHGAELGDGEEGEYPP